MTMTTPALSATALPPGDLASRSDGALEAASPHARGLARAGRFVRRAASLALPLVLAAALLAGPAAADTLLDARGTPVGTPDTARIVSIGGAVTEILYDLGLEDRIVAVDTTSTAPPRALAEKPNVGYMRALAAEGVLSTGPTLIVATEGAGPPEVMEVLGASSVPLVLVDDATTPEAVTGRIRFLAAALGAEERGEALAGTVEKGFADLAKVRAGIRTPARVLFVISLRDGVPMAAGTGTAADSIIGLAGGVNVAAGFEGYKPMSEEAVLAAAPDVVLMMTSGAHAAGGDVLASPAFRGTPAAANGRLVTMDGQSLLGFGPRTPEVARALAAELHPGQIAAAGTP
jgi:iron complex transport system substrate-binding protein